MENLDRLNKLLSIIDFKAIAEDIDSDNPYIGMIDLQGGNYGDIESEKFNSASEVVDRLSTYFEDTFLDGEICCDYDGKFETYEEAERTARRTGYIEEADAIKLLMEIADS